MAGDQPLNDDRMGDGADGVQIRTFLIADVRGYTLFTQEHGDEMAAKLAAKFGEIAREGVEPRRGTLLELRGDEALCVFPSARDAIRAAVELQQRFVEETIDQPELPLTVGIGLDAGEAVPVHGGYRGGALNLAARLCGQARAGEILASREVTHLARRVDGVRYVDRGRLSLKGLSDPVAIVQVVPETADPVERLRAFAPSRPLKRTTSRRWAVAAGVTVVLALVAISLPLLRSGNGTVEVGTDSIARLNADDGTRELATELGERPGPTAIGFGSLWVAEPDRGVVARLDLRDGSVNDTIPVGTSPAGVAVGEGSVWVTNAVDGTVSRIDPETNEVTQMLDAGSGPSGIAVGDGALWIADAIGAQLLRIDPTSGESEAVALTGQPSGVAFTPNGVWVTFAPAGIARVDPASQGVTLTKTVGSGTTAVLAAFGSIWVANHFDGTVSRLEPSTGRVQATIPVGEGPNALAAAASSLWVANELDDTITAIDPATNTERQTLPVGAATTSLAADSGSLWLAVGASAAEHRGGTLTVSSAGQAPTSLDPAVVFFGDTLEGQILSITNDGLVSFKKVGGAGGATLVPDLASALPEVSADGLSWRFPLRDGILYSTGDPVRPEDFRHALERTFSLNPESAGLFGAIVGAETCLDGSSPCDLSESIVTDSESVTFHLVRPDPDLIFKLAMPAALPVPVATPIEDQGLDPVPATGPYVITKADQHGIEIERNQEFREWSGSAQPDGFVHAMSWRFEEDPEPAFDRLASGQLDWMTDPRPDDVAMLQAAHPDQVGLRPNAATTFIHLDVRKPPFEDVRVRQALNYAIDRDHVAALLGGPVTHRPTCQILPPNFPGYEPFCPYTLEPARGVWSAPHLDRARALIEDGGTTGTKVTVWGADIFPGSVAVMRYVVKILNDLRLRANLRIVRDVEAYFGGEPQARLSLWFPDYPGAGGFISDGFRCDLGAGTAAALCVESLDDRIGQAQRLQATDPAAANRAWIEIEHQIVEDAILVPLTNPVTPYVFSARTENIQVHPVWGILLSRLWVQ